MRYFTCFSRLSTINPGQIPAAALFLLVLPGFIFPGCGAKNPVEDTYIDWEVDNTPWDAAPGDGIDGVDGIDGAGDPEVDYTTEFDVPDQDYVPDIPDSDGGIPVRSCGVLISHTPESSSDTITAAGEFNGWNPTSDELTDPDDDGVYTVSLELEEGEYAYKLVKNGTEWFLDPANPWTKYHCDGSCELNSNLRVFDCENPYLAMISFDAQPSGTISGRVQYVDGNLEAGPDASRVAVLLNGDPPDFEFDAMTGLITFEWGSLSAGKYVVRVEAADNEGRWAEPLFLTGWIEEEEFDWRDGVIYFAFTDRFHDGNSSNNSPIGVEEPADYRGGDFAGIRQKIEEGYFDAMGVNILWLSPPYENTSSSGIGHDGHNYSGYHGYWPEDPVAAETTFGGDADLAQLLDSAHDNGIRVLMDTVLNHVHTDHPYWAAHRSDGWFHGSPGDCICGQGSCDWDSHRIDCWFTSYLPDIDFTNHDALRTMIDDSLEWVFETGFDGMRVDAVKHFEHIVGQRLRLSVREKYEITGHKFYMVGETFTGGYGGGCGGGPDLIMQYINPNELDGQFDFPLFWVILDVFGRESADFHWLDSAIGGLDTCYGSFPIMSTFLGNHDVARFISIANGDDTGDPWNRPPPTPSSAEPFQRLKLAFTFLLTHTGVPLIYYGDEIGLAGAGDPDNRRLMKFTGLSGNEQMVLDRVKLAGSARKDYPGLRSSDRKTLGSVDANFYVYSRGTGGDAVIVALNRNSHEVTSPSISIPSDLGISDGTTFTDLVSSRTVTVSSGSISITVGGKDGAILVQE